MSKYPIQINPTVGVRREFQALLFKNASFKTGRKYQNKHNLKYFRVIPEGGSM
jgi:hypothetical protein